MFYERRKSVSGECPSSGVPIIAVCLNLGAEVNGEVRTALGVYLGSGNVTAGGVLTLSRALKKLFSSSFMQRETEVA